jgi:hypothetical protein
VGPLILQISHRNLMDHILDQVLALPWLTFPIPLLVSI